jgi:hypothetical protein
MMNCKESGTPNLSYSLWLYFPIIDISSDFQAFTLVYANRAWNQVAHVLAKQSRPQMNLG